MLRTWPAGGWKVWGGICLWYRASLLSSPSSGPFGFSFSFSSRPSGRLAELAVLLLRGRVLGILCEPPRPTHTFLLLLFPPAFSAAAKRQAAQGAEHAPNENMLPRQCITLGATVVFPCLCTAVEVAVVRQGAGEGDCAGASHGGQTGPAQKFVF